MFIHCDQPMRLIYDRYLRVDNPMLDVDSQQHMHGSSKDYQCPSCQQVIEVNGDVIACGTCGLEDCKHIEDLIHAWLPMDAEIPENLKFYYNGKRHWYGTDNGRDYELEIATGKVTRIYSLNYKQKVADSARITGAAIASRKSGVPAKTITSWMKTFPKVTK